jgi:hypothetical protein
MNVLSDKTLKNNLYEYLKKLTSKKEKQDIIQIYQIITSKNMLLLIRDYKEQINEDLRKLTELKAVIVKHAKNNPFIIYKVVYDYMYQFFDGKKQNTKIIFQTNKYSDRSEFIEDLHIDSYEKIIKYFNNFKYIETSSASPTIVLSANLNLDSAKEINSVRSLTILNTPKLFFKIYSTEIPGINDGLYIEQQIYEELFKLVKYNITPNILCKVAIAKNLNNFYNEFIKKIFPFFFKNDNYEIKHKIKLKMHQINIEKPHPKTKMYYGIRLDYLVDGHLIDKSDKNYINYLRHLKGLEDDWYKWDKTNVIVTQQGDLRMFDRLKNKQVSIKHLQSILFQLIYTFYVFEKIEFVHGDLHRENIFINKLKKPIDLYYQIKGITYKLTTDWIIKIYDFDHSQIFKESTISINENDDVTIKQILPVGKRVEMIPGVPNKFDKNVDRIRIFHILKNILKKIDALDANNSAEDMTEDGYNSQNEDFVPDQAASDDESDEKIEDDIITVIDRLLPVFTSDETYKETYKRVLFGDPEESKIQLKEANRYYNKNIQYKEKITDRELLKIMIDDFGIYENYINIKWKDILSETNPGLLRKDQKHNLIWVPDALILSSEQMLKDKFFENLVFRDPTNIRTEVIYTLDGKL